MFACVCLRVLYRDNIHNVFVKSRVKKSTNKNHILNNNVRYQKVEYEYTH